MLDNIHSALQILTLNSHNNSLWEGTIFMHLFLRWGNGGTERVRNLAVVIKVKMVKLGFPKPTALGSTSWPPKQNFEEGFHINKDVR